ncbi:MAG: YdcF family protein [Acidobacteria bacterium]|nr:YdcF family protein [Acidobacteriota bacterium]
MNFLKNAVELLFSPVGIMVLLLISGILLNFWKRRRVVGRRLMFCGVVLFLVFLFSPLAGYLMLNLEKDYAPMLHPPKQPRPGKILILSGYAEEYEGFPITSLLSEMTVGNLTEGLRLYRLMPDSVVIVSGGVLRKDERPVAASMADFLKQMGVPEERILIEGNSRNTYENFRESGKFLGTEPFILVAQACDMRRAMAVAGKLGMQPLAAPASYWALQRYSDLNKSKKSGGFSGAFLYPSVENLNRLQWAYHEYAGYLWYRLRGWV